MLREQVRMYYMDQVTGTNYCMCDMTLQQLSAQDDGIAIA